MPQSADQFSGIFICYRRDDSAGHAGRLYDRLAAHFGEDQVFMDVDYIEPGADFVRVIEEAVGSCEILLALIGRSWLASQGETGRRLDNPNDFVRLEIAAALARGVHVIPVLVHGAQMPQDLPKDLLPLSRRNALEISDQRWNHDVSKLIATVKKEFAEREESRRLAEELELQRLKAEEAERKRREAEELSLAPVAHVAGTTRKGSDLVILLAGAFLIVEMVVMGVLLLLPSAVQAEANDPALLPVLEPLVSFPETLDSKTRLDMVAIHGGTFNMGTSLEELNEVRQLNNLNKVGRQAPRDETDPPVRTVTVRSFYISRYEVTQAQWRAVMGADDNPSKFQDADDLPVENVSLYDAQRFCERLSQMSGRQYRLPNEAEWEYAARASTTTPFAFGSSLSSGQANFDGGHPYGRAQVKAFLKRTTHVGAYDRNDFGLYDMHGNVWEWCDGDTYRGTAFAFSSNVGVLRGGGWNSPATNLRSGYRLSLSADSRAESPPHGFRVVAVAR